MSVAKAEEQDLRFGARWAACEPQQQMFAVASQTGVRLGQPSGERRPSGRAQGGSGGSWVGFESCWGAGGRGCRFGLGASVDDAGEPGGLERRGDVQRPVRWAGEELLGFIGGEFGPVGP